VHIMAHVRPTGSAVSFEDTIPSRFSGWHYNTWTLVNLRQVAAAVSLVVQDGIQKRDLYQLIVELKPEPSSLSLAEANAIQTIKDARSISKASTSTNQGNVTSIQATPASKKCRLSARYLTPRKRRSKQNVVDLSSDSEYVDSDDDNSGSTASHSSPGAVPSGGLSNSNFSSPSLLTRFNEVAIPDDGAKSPQYGLPATLLSCTSIETCEVCSEGISHRNRLPRNPTSNCTHDHNFICLSCLQQHIKASASTQTWGNIRCPHASCKAVLSFNDMQSFAPLEVFARYDVYINRKGLEALSDYVPCANVQCGSGGIVDSAADSFATCSSCGVQTCVACKTRYHPGLTHGENMAALTEAEQGTERAQERVEEEAASQTFVNKRTKPCPNQECGVRIQKTSGCNHMTCTYINIDTPASIGN
jgi:hypothetical protein